MAWGGGELAELPNNESVRDLGAVSSEPLCAAVGRLPPEAWREDSSRQALFDVHRHTQSVVLLFVDVEQWPHLVVRRAAGWAHLGAVADSLMDAVVQANYPPGGVRLRAMVVRLPAGARIAPHRDRHDSFRQSHRIHIPLTTNPRVRFHVDGVPRSLPAGRAFEINNQKPHSVMNNGATDRVHFIFDYLPAAQLAAPGLAHTL